MKKIDPSLNWPSPELKKQEFKFARNKIKYWPNGTLLTSDCSKLTHAFISFNLEIYAFCDKKPPFASGKYAKVYYAENEKSQSFVIKMGRTPGNICPLELNISKDIGQLTSEGYLHNYHNARHPALPYEYHSKSVEPFRFRKITLHPYLGVTVATLAPEVGHTLSIEFSVKCADELQKLNEGKLSGKGIAYIHRDFKSDNILIHKANDIHIIDFGHTLPIKKNTFKKIKAQLKLYIGAGTFHTAPEIKRHKYHALTDIYSLRFIYDILLLPNYLYLTNTARTLLDQMTRYEPLFRPHHEVIKAILIIERFDHSSTRAQKWLKQYNTTITTLETASELYKSFQSNFPLLLNQLMLAWNVIRYSPEFNHQDYLLELTKNNVLCALVAKNYRKKSAHFIFKQWNALKSLPHHQEYLRILSNHQNYLKEIKKNVFYQKRKLLRKAISILIKAYNINAPKQNTCLQPCDWKLILKDKTLQITLAAMQRHDLFITVKDYWKQLNNKCQLQLAITQYCNAIRFGKASSYCIKEIAQEIHLQEIIISIDKSQVKYAGLYHQEMLYNNKYLTALKIINKLDSNLINTKHLCCLRRNKKSRVAIIKFNKLFSKFRDLMISKNIELLLGHWRLQRFTIEIYQEYKNGKLKNEEKKSTLLKNYAELFYKLFRLLTHQISPLFFSQKNRAEHIIRPYRIAARLGTNLNQHALLFRHRAESKNSKCHRTSMPTLQIEL